MEREIKVYTFGCPKLLFIVTGERLLLEKAHGLHLTLDRALCARKQKSLASFLEGMKVIFFVVYTL